MDVPSNMDAAITVLSQSEANALANFLALTDYNEPHSSIGKLLCDSLEDHLELLSIPMLVAMAQLAEE